MPHKKFRINLEKNRIKNINFSLFLKKLMRAKLMITF